MARFVNPADGFLIQSRSTVVCLGDGITEHADGFVPVLRNLITATYPERHIHVINAGTAGQTAPEMLARLDRDVLPYRPNWVMISAGINDVSNEACETNLKEYRKALSSLATRLLHLTNIQLVFVTPTLIGENPSAPINLLLECYVTTMMEIAAEYDFVVTSTHSDFISTLVQGKTAFRQFSLTTDGLHLNPIGAHVVALSILKALRWNINGEVN